MHYLATTFTLRSHHSDRKSRKILPVVSFFNTLLTYQNWNNVSRHALSIFDQFGISYSPVQIGYVCVTAAWQLPETNNNNAFSIVTFISFPPSRRNGYRRRSVRTER